MLQLHIFHYKYYIGVLLVYYYYTPRLSRTAERYHLLAVFKPGLEGFWRHSFISGINGRRRVSGGVFDSPPEGSGLNPCPPTARWRLPRRPLPRRPSVCVCVRPDFATLDEENI